MFNQGNPVLTNFTIEVYSRCAPCMIVETLSLYRGLLEKELETVGIRMNKPSPNVYFKVRHNCSCYISANPYAIAKEGWWDIHYFHGTASQNVRENGSNDSS